jgi:hypothetical protein
MPQLSCFCVSSPVVASDRTIGGFCHSWGEDQPKVKKKKRMLEAEGIKFELDGRKIMNEHFVNNNGGDGTKKRNEKTKATKQSSKTNNNTASKPIATAAFDEITEQMLKQEILQLLDKRAPGKTC